jgi:4-carboxymuconolactone decarboxylase
MMRSFAGAAPLATIVCLLVPVPAGPAQQPGAGTAAATAPSPQGGYSTVLDSGDLDVQRRRFEAGQRTYWHSHERGFLLLVESGRARTQRAGAPMRELRVGEVDYTPPGVLHWHGAGPGDDLVQVGVLFGGGITFTDPVTDDQYQGP